MSNSADSQIVQSHATRWESWGISLFRLHPWWLPVPFLGAVIPLALLWSPVAAAVVGIVPGIILARRQFGTPMGDLTASEDRMNQRNRWNPGSIDIEDAVLRIQVKGIPYVIAKEDILNVQKFSNRRGDSFTAVYTAREVLIARFSTNAETQSFTDAIYPSDSVFYAASPALAFTRASGRIIAPYAALAIGIVAMLGHPIISCVLAAVAALATLAGSVDTPALHFNETGLRLVWGAHSRLIPRDSVRRVELASEDPQNSVVVIHCLGGSTIRLRTSGPETAQALVADIRRTLALSTAQLPYR